jgi:hypothetical protein
MMFTTLLPSAAMHTVSEEEYRTMKRRLYGLRCQYTRLLGAIRAGRVEGSTQVRAEKLEGRINALELRVAYSTVHTPDEAPMTVHDIFHAAKQEVSHVWQTLVAWMITVGR